MKPSDNQPYLDILAADGITVTHCHFVYRGPDRIPTRRFQADGVPFDLSIGIPPSAALAIVREALDEADRRSK